MRKKFFRFLIRLVILVAVVYILQGISKRGPQSDAIKYELVSNWPVLPSADPCGLGVDTSGNIIVFQRAGRKWPLLGSMPKEPIKSRTILVVDASTGRLLNSWGDNLFIMPHGLTVDHDNNVWVTDVGLHQVFKFSHEGKLLMKLGEAGVAGNDKLHFNQPTDIAVARDGSFYVSDGYGNSRVIKFSPSGKYLFQWGKKEAAGANSIFRMGCRSTGNKMYM